MKLVLLPLLLLALAVPVCGEESKPYVWGHFASHLTPDALAAAIRAATTESGQPWAIFADHSQVLPEVRYIDAFLPPTRSTSRFRRGVVLHLQCRPAVEDGECVGWEVMGDRSDYIQVAGQRNFATALRVRSHIERPILIEGQLSDRELISLVEYVRSNRGNRGRFAMCGDDPIKKIERGSGGHVLIVLSADAVGGCNADVQRTPEGWQLVGLTFWVR